MRDDTVGNQFDHLGRDSFGTEDAGVDNVIAPNGGLCAVFSLLVDFEFTDDLDLGDFFAAVSGDIPEPYVMKCVSAFDTFLCAV